MLSRRKGSVQARAAAPPRALAGFGGRDVGVSYVDGHGRPVPPRVLCLQLPSWLLMPRLYVFDPDGKGGRPDGEAGTWG
jgi:hypothetical protein